MYLAHSASWEGENMNEIILGDCLEEMKKIDSKSIDCLVTDPPFAFAGG